MGSGEPSPAPARCPLLLALLSPDPPFLVSEQGAQLLQRFVGDWRIAGADVSGLLCLDPGSEDPPLTRLVGELRLGEDDFEVFGEARVMLASHSVELRVASSELQHVRGAFEGTLTLALPSGEGGTRLEAALVMDEPAGYGRQGLVAGDMAASQLTLEWRELTGAAPGTCRMTMTDCGNERLPCCLIVWLSEGLWCHGSTGERSLRAHRAAGYRRGTRDLTPPPPHQPAASYGHCSAPTDQSASAGGWPLLPRRCSHSQPQKPELYGASNAGASGGWNQ